MRPDLIFFLCKTGGLQLVKRMPDKSIWNPGSRDVYTFFCPHCRAERRLAHHPNPYQLKHLLQVGLTAIVFTILFYSWFTWKGVVSFIPFWMVFEIYFRIRVRGELFCQACGFDPFLFLTDMQRARREIQDHWRKKFAEKGIPFPETTDLDSAKKKSRDRQKPMIYNKSSTTANAQQQNPTEKATSKKISS